MNHALFEEGLASDPKQRALLGQLSALWKSLQGVLHQKFNRTLPLGDYIVDRWEKAKILGFGEGSSLYDSSLVLGDVTVGDQTWIGPFTVLDGSGGLEIGSHCSISAGVQLYSHDSVQWAISGGTVPMTHAKTTVGDRCYLGPNTVVAKGVTIGEGCIIGANSVVLHDIPPHSKAYGNPAQVAGPVALETGTTL